MHRSLSPSGMQPQEFAWRDVWVCMYTQWMESYNNVHVSKLTTCMDRISLPGPSFDILTCLTTNYSCNMYTRDLFCKWLQDWVHLSLTYTGLIGGDGVASHPPFTCPFVHNTMGDGLPWLASPPPHASV